MHPKPHLDILCAENIALSALLSRIPVSPSRNDTQSTEIPLPARKDLDQLGLSFNTEKKLARTLAFICHVDSKTDHIPALALHPDSEAHRLDVIVAVNRISYKDGEEVMSRIKEGMDGIFAVLAGVSVSSSSRTGFGAENKVLKAIVAMCSQRIRYRLRLGRINAFKNTLQEAVLGVEKLEKQKLRTKKLLSTVDQFKRIANQVCKLIDSWSRHQTNPELVKIVEGMHPLRQINRLSDLIHTVPNRDMDPLRRKSLLNIICKVSRYREAARFLYRTAKKVPWARNMKAVPVRLPREAFERQLVPSEYGPELKAKITQAVPKRSQKKLLKEICAIIGVSQQDAIDQYAQQVTRTLTEGKIHAEVQVIAYCEIQRPNVYPRLICSSKDACFLCNMFIRVYRKAYTPRSHGVLYPGWRLPCLPQLMNLEEGFCHALENHFSSSLATLLANRKRVVHPKPNESNLSSLPFSTTTVAGSIAPVVAGPIDFGEAGTSDVCAAPAPDETECLKAISDMNTDKAPSQENDDGITHPEPRIKSEQASTRQESLHLQVGESSALHRTGSLEIQIEHATGSRDLEYQLTWLNAGEEEAVEARKKGAVVDAEILEGPVYLNGLDSLFLQAKDTVLKLSWNSGCLSG